MPRFLTIFLLALLSIPAHAGEKNRKPPFSLPEDAAAVALTDVAGKEFRPLETEENGAAVLIFISVDCPIANAYAPEISRIAKEYEEKGVRLTLLHADPALDDKEAAAHAADYGLDAHARIAVDREHRLVRLTGATITPDAVVVTPSGEVVYRGRINNLYADLGDKRAAPSEHDLRNALDAVLAGKPVPLATAKSIGCIIEPL